MNPNHRSKYKLKRSEKMEKKSTEEKGIVLGFTCPTCGNHVLNEITVAGQMGQRVIAEVTYYPDSSRAELDYIPHSGVGGTRFEEKRFYCPECLYLIRHEDSLAEWLRNNCPQTTNPKG
jgi:predicted RNA-binding Zn-ribbon protein involved in translation (DUF1610 family)